jgi:hypothetical protein
VTAANYSPSDRTIIHDSRRAATQPGDFFFLDCVSDAAYIFASGNQVARTEEARMLPDPEIDTTRLQQQAENSQPEKKSRRSRSGAVAQQPFPTQEDRRQMRPDYSTKKDKNSKYQ